MRTNLRIIKDYFYNLIEFHSNSTTLKELVIAISRFFCPHFQVSQLHGIVMFYFAESSCNQVLVLCALFQDYSPCYSYGEVDLGSFLSRSVSSLSWWSALRVVYENLRFYVVLKIQLKVSTNKQYVFRIGRFNKLTDLWILYPVVSKRCGKLKN